MVENYILRILLLSKDGVSWMEVEAAYYWVSSVVACIEVKPSGRVTDTWSLVVWILSSKSDGLAQDGRPRISSISDRPSRGRSWSSLDSGRSTIFLKWENLRPTSLSLAHLSPPFHRLIDQHVHVVQRCFWAKRAGYLLHVGPSIHGLGPVGCTD